MLVPVLPQAVYSLPGKTPTFVLPSPTCQDFKVKQAHSYLVHLYFYLRYTTLIPEYVIDKNNKMGILPTYRPKLYLLYLIISDKNSSHLNSGVNCSC